MNDNQKIVQFPGSTPAIPFEKKVAEMKSELPFMIEYFKVHAELTRAKYLALREQGFNEQEALALCINLFS